MGVFALAATVASTALGAIGSIKAGNAANEAAKFEAAQMDEQARNEHLRANKFEYNRRQELRQSMASLTALQSGLNINLNQGSAVNVKDRLRQTASDNIRVARFNASQHSRNLRMGAKVRRAQGRAAKTAGLFGAARSVLGGVSTVNKGIKNGLFS